MSFYTIQRGHDILSVNHKNTQYFIGFKKAITARTVQYSLNPEPKIQLLRGDKIHSNEIYFDVNSSLFLPKCKGSTLDPMNDGCFHMNQMEQADFFLLTTKRCGIIIPYDLKHEDDDEFVFTSFVIDPIPTIRDL